MHAMRPFAAGVALVCVFAASGLALADGQEPAEPGQALKLDSVQPAAHTARVQRVAQDIRVSLDEAFPLRLADSAQGVAVGNPSIAGVSVQNDRFLFVTGRSYGSTNLVVVGADDRVLYSGRVVVSPDETGVVMVTRGGETARLECTPLCRPRPDIGDSQESQAVNQQITTHASTAASAAR